MKIMIFEVKLAEKLSSIFTFLLARGLPAIVNFFAITFYAHQLLPAEYGQYSLILLYASFISTFIFSWFNMALLRFFEEKKADKQNLIYTIKQTFLCISLAILLIAVPLCIFLNIYILLVALLAISQSFLQLCLQLLVSEVKPKRYAVLSILNSSLCLFLAYILICFAHMQQLGIIIAMIFSSLLAVSRLYWESWRVKQKYTIDMSLLRSLFKYGYPLSLSMIIGLVIYGTDRIMLDYFGGKESVGLYSLPYDIANQSITLIFMAFQLYFYPLVLQILHASGKLQAREQLEENGKIFIILLMPCMLFLMFFSEKIAEIITRQQYHQAFSAILPIIAVSAVLQGFKAFYYDLSFQLSQKTWVQLGITIFIIVVNFVLNLWLIPQYNYTGAAYASVIVSLMGVILSYNLGKKYFHIPSLLTYTNIKYFLVGAALGYVFFNIKNINNMFVLGFLVLLSVVLYFAAVFTNRQQGLRILKIIFFKRI